MIEIVLGVIVAVLAIALFLVATGYFSLKSRFDSLLFSKQSQSVKYGQLTEQWIPFSSKYPYNSQNFRFIGKPVDGVSFEDDKIVFVEFKTNKSRLSDSQNKIKELVKEKKVEWFELRAE